MMTRRFHHRYGAAITCCALCIAWVLAVSFQTAGAQERRERKEDERALSLRKPSSLLDRAGGAHNKSNIGSYFVNRGKLYASDYSQGRMADRLGA